jgi:hypothetical protein
VPAVVEDMRSVDPLGYIRAVGLRPEDSYGFLPLDLHDVTPYFFLYRDRPEYAEKRTALPGAQSVGRFGPVEVMPTQSVEMDLHDVSQMPGGGGLEEIVAQAEQMQQQWAGVAPGAPAPEPDKDRIARVEKLKEMGAINEEEYARLLIEAGGTPGDAPVSAPPGAPGNAPPLVMDRIYPGLHMRSSTRQLDDFLPGYRDALGLCPEDVYGVFPRSTRTSNSGDGGSETEWDDFWIVYRERDEYAQGRASWAAKMNKKGNWPQAVVAPGVAEPGRAPFGGEKVEVKKERWPREKLVMKKKGSDLGDALREKLGKWSYEPEDSYGFCPDFGGGKIYFAWRKR